MSVNTMTLEQGNAFLSAIVAQMQGGSLSSVNTGNFVSVAQNALLQGVDPLLTAMSQVLSKTIFSIRPYRGKFSGIAVDSQKYGNIVRKVNYIDGALEPDQRVYYSNNPSVPYANGQSPNPDQWAFRKPQVWQSNFYSAETYQRVTTIYKDQLDVSLQSSAAFAEFLTGQIQNIVDQLEQVSDAKARAALINYIGGKMTLEADSDPAVHCVHLFTDYAADTGVTLTLSNYLAPSNYKPFVEWMYAKIATITDMMSERGHMFNFSPSFSSGVKTPIERHTPKDRLKAYFIASEFNRIQAMAISEVFNRDELRMIDFNAVNFWQSADDPYNITASVTVNNTATVISTPTTNDLKTASVTTKGTPDTPVLGVLFDEDALGMTIVNEGVYDTGLNAASLTNNRFWHFTNRIWNDFSENGVVLMLD